jgi:hypothetical protein
MHFGHRWRLVQKAGDYEVDASRKRFEIHPLISQRNEVRRLRALFGQCRSRGTRTGEHQAKRLPSRMKQLFLAT